MAFDDESSRRAENAKDPYLANDLAKPIPPRLAGGPLHCGEDFVELILDETVAERNMHRAQRVAIVGLYMFD